jgi:hypothetical protein
MVLTRKMVSYLKNQQIRGKFCRFTRSEESIVTYIPGTRMIVISSGEEYILLNSSGEKEFLSRKSLSDIYRSLPEPSVNDKRTCEYDNLFQTLLDYIGPGNTLRITSAPVLFDVKSFSGITFYAMNRHVALEFTEEPYLNSAKYYDLLQNRIPEDCVRSIIQNDFSIAREKPLNSIIKERASEELKSILTIGSTVNHSDLRNTIVECICRLHIDCCGYLTTAACSQYIREVLGIREEIKDSTFRHYVDEAKEISMNEGMRKSPLWLTAILPDCVIL